jgi:hypothetical protein
MSRFRQEMDKRVQSLKQQRHALKLKFSLGQSNLKNGWNKVGKRWYRFKSKTSADASGASYELENKLKIIAEEIKNAYGRIRERL